MPGDDLLPAHEGRLITRGLQEQACLLAQDLPFATAVRLLSGQSGEPAVLSASTLRTLVRHHGARIRCLEQGEATSFLSTGARGERLRGVPVERPRRQAGWPIALSAAVEMALADGQRRSPDGVSPGDGDRIRAARATDPTASVETRRRRGPEVATGQMLLVLDEVLTRATEQGPFHELRMAACSRRTGAAISVGLALPSCATCRPLSSPAVRSPSLSSLMEPVGSARFSGIMWPAPRRPSSCGIGTISPNPCRDLAARICPERARRRRLVRQLLCALGAGSVPRAMRVLAAFRRREADPDTVDTLCLYLQAQAAWIPD